MGQGYHRHGEARGGELKLIKKVLTMLSIGTCLLPNGEITMVRLSVGWHSIFKAAAPQRKCGGDRCLTSYRLEERELRGSRRS